MDSDYLLGLRYRLIPDHLLGELLSKQWVDTVVPVILLAVSMLFFGLAIPNFVGFGSVSVIGGYLGEIVIAVVGMTIVILAGGIDLSVGSIFGLCNFVCLALFNYLGWPLWLVIPSIILLGGLAGAVNGILIGYVRTRAFLTTLATLIIIRAIVDTLSLQYGADVSATMQESEIWDYISFKPLLAMPTSLLTALIICVVAHVFITRTRVGWRILAVGGSRRSAYNAGIDVRRTVCFTYVFSGMLMGLAAIFYAARLNSVAPETGLGLELTVLTSAVVGGISLGGGKGSIPKALFGAILVAVALNGMAMMGVQNGVNSLVLGGLLLLAVAFDIRWLKNRGKLVSRIYVSPTYFKLPAMPETAQDSGAPYAINDKFHNVEIFGKGDLDGPEDLIFDSEDNFYTGSRKGDLIRFFAPDYQKWEVFAHTGGIPLGLAMDKEGSIITCIAGMGLYKVTKQREVVRLTDETNRRLLSITDDSLLRLADDLDIADDGRIFFSEATIRYSQHEWMVDGLECRPNGRLICYDPARGTTTTVLPRLRFPNGVCMVGDGESLLFAETWACRINRYWFSGPQKGHVEPIILDLPGYPDNINRASDGCFWLALCGMRTPAYDTMLAMPGVRKRMAREVARDEWLYPNMNTGCVIKFDLTGRIVETLWDIGGINHPLISSTREHKGYLYLGGVNNDRIGRYRLKDADSDWTSQGSYWGARK